MNQKDIQKNHERAETLLSEQRLVAAILAGAMAALVLSAIYGIVVARWSFSSGFAAAGIGIIIGLFIQFLGRGVETRFMVMAGLLTIAACCLGRVFAVIPPLDALKAGSGVEIFLQEMSALSFVDLVFWIVAVIAACSLAKRTLSRADRLAIDTYESQR